MKVAFFSGPLEYSVCLANALSKHCEVSFYYRIKNAKDRDDSILNALEPAIKKCPINSYRLRDFRNIFSYLKIALRLRNYDIVHIQNGDVWFSLWRFIFKATPVIFTVHDPNQHIGIRSFNRNYQDFAQQWGIKQSVNFIVHGEKLKDDLAIRYVLPRERIFVLEHGEFSIYKKIRRNNLSNTRAGSREKIILFFGIIRKNKGLEFLIKAEPIISKSYSNYKIRIAGKFPGDRAVYESMIKDKNKFEIIDDFIKSDSIAEILEDSDIVALPYITATQSGVLSLAFGFGKPVVATKTGSLSEIVEDGITGLLVPPGQVEALATALLDLLRNETKCLQFGENASKYAMTTLNWEKIAEKTVGLYQECLKKGQSN